MLGDKNAIKYKKKCQTFQCAYNWSEHCQVKCMKCDYNSHLKGCDDWNSCDICNIYDCNAFQLVLPIQTTVE